MDSVDMILRIYHNAVQSGDLQVGQSAKLDSLLEKVSFPPRRTDNRMAQADKVAHAIKGCLAHPGWRERDPG